MDSIELDLRVLQLVRKYESTDSGLRILKGSFRVHKDPYYVLIELSEG